MSAYFFDYCCTLSYVIILAEKLIIPYFHEIFEHQPIKMFLNSNAADTRSHGDIKLNLGGNISPPTGTT